MRCDGRAVFFFFAMYVFLTSVVFSQLLIGIHLWLRLASRWIEMHCLWSGIVIEMFQAYEGMRKTFLGQVL